MVAGNQHHIRLKVEHALDLGIHALDLLDLTVEVSIFAMGIGLFDVQVKEIKLLPKHLQR